MTLERYFERQSADHSALLRQVHQLILDQHPGIQALIKYGIPFYVLRKNLCYLCIQKNKVILGIVEGHRLHSVYSLLDFTGRTQIGHLAIDPMTEQRYSDLMVVLATAIEYDLQKTSKG
ncbi:MAG: hypothetical protein A3D92_00750 [Bacteroidetes bacterium RIFCSPHIGHO2_02_FULL_44_7]|nr:MAG: hypothetical protein A3D92_00750 [Bacteroidetes bacterium RIFCSPHIGHO2_02_FULL_44_7]